MRFEEIIKNITGWIQTFREENFSFSVTPSEQESRGDLATNAAFVLAKKEKASPLLIAQALSEHLSGFPLIEKAEAAGGFVNITLIKSLWPSIIEALLQEKESYGHCTYGSGQTVDVEYVSANPTGPLHAGHARIALVGDVLANIFEAVGYRVIREYYLNDAGHQIDVLARSVYARYQGIVEGKNVTPAEGLYPGLYLQDVAEAFYQKEGDRWIGKKEKDWLRPIGNFAVEELMSTIQEDLCALGISFDVIVSERSLQNNGLVWEAVEILKEKGYVYTGTLPTPQGYQEQGEATAPVPLCLFRSTAFGDDQDRPLTKADGEWTYFAGELGYRLDQYRKGLRNLTAVWGADHASHVTRTQAAVKALTEGEVSLEVELCQIVNFFDQGIPMKMSKRAGTFLTLQDVLQHIDPEVLRFFMVSKKADTHMDFDFERAKEQTKDNPVFYVHYAHARCCSVLSIGKEKGFYPALSLKGHIFFEEESALVRTLADWPRQLLLAAQAREPHRLTTYLHRLATEFHALWHKGKSEAILRFIQPEEPPLTEAHLALVEAVRFTIASGLRILGITPKEEMR